MANEKRVYSFGNKQAEGNSKMKNLLGGKGANLAEMSSIGVPVPPGFTITTEVCAEYNEVGKDKIIEYLKEDVEKEIKKVEEATNTKFGSSESPCLLSVRSGARVSMPGMMDTVLNLGMNDDAVEGLTKKTNNPRFAWDSYRRFVQMYGDVVLGLKPKSKEDIDPFEAILEEVKEKKGVELDTQLEIEDLKELVKKFKEAVKKQTGHDFPSNPWDQLWGAIMAVFDSWNNPRANYYRALNQIPEEWGTAVNVQAMVFGNMGESSATGVAFTRNPSTGEKALYGEFLINAQGEDVVAGIRTPQDITEAARAASNSDKPSMEKAMPEAFAELVRIYGVLEGHYRDMQDLEFTVEKGKLWMLQTRNGKRTARAALRIACDLVDEGVIGEEEAVTRVEPQALDQLLHPMIDPRAERDIIATGLPASPGAASGAIVFSSDAAEAAKK